MFRLIYNNTRVLSTTAAVKFYIANMVIALEHMHSKDIAYRNLKPENVLLHANGYLVLVGLGLAKKIPYICPGEELKYFKSFTICGTAEYLAPEMVLGSGHDQAVDLWALGVVVFEMIHRRTPFQTGDDINVDEVMAAIAASAVDIRLFDAISLIFQDIRSAVTETSVREL